MLRIFLYFLRESIRNQEIVLATCLPAIGVLFIPLQHYMPLARAQHGSFSLMFLSLGFSLQTGWSWRRVSLWGKLALAGSALFTGSLAYFYWSNPWLANMQLATAEQRQGCYRFFACMSFAVVPLLVVVLMWGKETLGGSLVKATQQTEEVKR